ncbi:MAG: flagellar biosynthetic protein FliR [Firmicutes bacterium]|nr:flagellar biosynthetic protein FliR [Bacillota bacterium]
MRKTQVTLDLLASRFPILLLVFARFSGLFASAPVFSSRYIPAQVKAMAVGFLSVFTMPFVGNAAVPDSLVGLAMYAVNELAVGLAIGYVAGAVLSAVQIAGQLIDTELGFGMVNVLDPQYGLPVPMFGNFYYLTALMLLIGWGGDRTIISALVRSYGDIPVGAAVRAPGPAFPATLISGVFLAALRISAPLLGALFMVTLALGAVARTVPQMNVFMVGLPVKIVVGLVILAATFPVFGVLVESLVDDMARGMATISGMLAR